MTKLWDEMITVLRRGAEELSREGREEILSFLRTQIRGGGFTGPLAAEVDKADLYYTFFGLHAWLSVEGGSAFSDTAKAWLASEDVADKYGALDLAHLCAVEGARRLLGLPFSPEGGRQIGMHERAGRMYAMDRESPPGALYPTFLVSLAVGGNSAPQAIRNFRSASGGYANTVADVPTAPATAAALALLSVEGGTDAEAVRWLRGRIGADGVRASDDAPRGDLLSTATALFALSLHGERIGALREPLLDYAAGCWNGGFQAMPDHGAPDAEYTFYGLLALGALAKMK